MSSHEQRTPAPTLLAMEDDLLAAVVRFVRAIRKRTRSTIVVVMFAIVLGGIHCAWLMQSPAVYETTAEVAVVAYAPELRGIHRFLVTADPVLKATVDRLPTEPSEQWKSLSPSQQVTRIRGGLTVSFRQGTNNILQLSYQSHDSRTGSLVLNALIASYTDLIAFHMIGRRRLSTYMPHRPKTGTVALDELIGAYAEFIASRMNGQHRSTALSQPPLPGSIRPAGIGANEYYLQPIRLPSVPSQPVPFRWWRILAAWTFGGLLIGLGQVYVRETIERIGNRVESPAETATDHPVPSSRAA